MSHYHSLQPSVMGRARFSLGFPALWQTTAAAMGRDARALRRDLLSLRPAEVYPLLSWGHRRVVHVTNGF